MTGKRPKNRYHSSLVYMAQNHLFPSQPFKSISSLRNVGSLIHHALLLYGGDGNFPLKGYMDDMWVLTMEQVQQSIPGDDMRKTVPLEESTTVRESFCTTLMIPDGTELHEWEWTCGVFADMNSKVPCEWEAIVVMAWCKQQYQSFRSPL